MLQAQPLLPDPVAAVPATLYARLIDGASPDLDAFDAHLLACILTIAATETVAQPLTEAVGLQPDALAVMLAGCFPRIAGALGSYAARGFALAADEASLVDLLQQAACGPIARHWLAPMVARRAQRPDHLWQDLGLRARTELSALMMRHFRPLAVRNTQDMKWKKYLYRTLCLGSGAVLCTAPSCSECDDFDACFGEETGESFLARIRRREERDGRGVPASGTRPS